MLCLQAFQSDFVLCLQAELADRQQQLTALQQRMEAELAEQQRRHKQELAEQQDRHISVIASERARLDQEWAAKAEAQVCGSGMVPVCEWVENRWLQEAEAGVRLGRVGQGQLTADVE